MPASRRFLVGRDVMRIAIMMQPSDSGGSARDSLHDLIEAMQSVAPEHEYLLLHRDAKTQGRFAAYPNVRDLVLEAHPLAWEQISVPLAVWRESVDVVLNPTLSGPLLSRAPVVMRMQAPDAWRGGPAWLERLRIQTVYPALCNAAAGLLADSSFDLEESRRLLGLPLEHATVARGCLAKHLQPIDERAALAEFRACWSLPQPFLVALAHADPQRAGRAPGFDAQARGQPDAVLRAFQICRTEIPHHLVFVGQHVEAALRMRGFSELDFERVRFIESIPHEDLPKLYGCAEASFMSAEHEGNPIEMMESMACGCPVIASHTGACPEIGGEAAVYVDVGDPQDVARKVVWLARDAALRTGLKLKVRQRAETFARERTARATLACLDATLRRPR
jgi:glycosyltransferase involved in cell wall biosynthesis